MFLLVVVSCGVAAAADPFLSELVDLTPENTHLGYWPTRDTLNNKLPALSINNEDTVLFKSTSGCAPGHIHTSSGFALPPSMDQIFKAKCASHTASKPTPFPCGAMGPHLLTGPIEVKGAKPGDALQVDILSIDVWQPWSWNMVKPPKGSLQYDFDDVHDGAPASEIQTWKNDLDKRATFVSPPGVWVAWNVTSTGPFFGCMGTAPPPAFGVVSTVPPRPEFGGNMDLKLLTTGASLQLPVNVAGALFSAGDGHAVQGDGEVCTTAVETGLLAKLRFTILPGKRLKSPRALTPTHIVSIGLSENLDEAQKLAMKDLLNWLNDADVAGYSTSESYRLASVAADMAVTQVVNQVKGVHLSFPRSLLPRESSLYAAPPDRKSRGGSTRTEL